VGVKVADRAGTFWAFRQHEINEQDRRHAEVMGHAAVTPRAEETAQKAGGRKYQIERRAGILNCWPL